MRVPAFTEPVPDNGYRWWYLDAISDDEEHALTIIVFIGSVFSPYYAWARKRGNARASQFCSVNVALYGPKSRWCMTERSESSVRATQQSLTIGKSRISLDQNRLVINVDEIAVPVPRRISGTVTLELPDYDLEEQSLDSTDKAVAEHFWQPIAPQTRIRVNLSSPALNWEGNAYMDSNHGVTPLESSFRSWTWSRSHESGGATTILYDVLTRQGQSLQRSLRYTSEGKVFTVERSREMQLEPTRYFRIKRNTRTTANTRIEAVQTLEDAPFYARSRFTTVNDPINKPVNEPAAALMPGSVRAEYDSGSPSSERQFTVHESLDLDRFDSAWVRLMLPFRMPRITRQLLVSTAGTE